MEISRNSRKHKTAATASSPSDPPPPPPSWTELPEDVTTNILQRLGAEEILKSAEKVCTAWNQVCRRDPSWWRVVHLRSNRRGEEARAFDLMCRCAVDRSQGQLIDLSITGFGGDNLLNYVAYRCSNLRRLALENPIDISPLALTYAVKKLPQLEALHLIKASYLEVEDVETIGLSCPLLKSFTYHSKWGLMHYEDNAVALGIAKAMPSLHHLRLIGNGMNNEGLEAILDGCPHLELLNVRECYSLDLKAGALGERCSNQVKDVSLPIERPSEGDLLGVLRFPIEIPDELLDALDSMPMDSDGDYYYDFYD